jgi:hypothetical protein
VEAEVAITLLEELAVMEAGELEATTLELHRELPIQVAVAEDQVLRRLETSLEELAVLE